MALEHDFQKTMQELSQHAVSHLQLGESDVTICVLDQSHKLRLSTPVYLGSEFIPHQVRECVTEGIKQDFPIKTALSIDEDAHRIDLNFLGLLDGMNKKAFISLLEEFAIVADVWRTYLDENDKKELIHVRRK